MFPIRIIKLGRRYPYIQSIFTSQVVLKGHTETCPTNRKTEIVCPTSPRKPPETPGCTDNGGSSSSKIFLKRAPAPGKVRLGFIPDEWFLFFHPTTGVTGPYIFGIMLTNYLVSKEIYVMEHEYYTGLSIFVMVYYCTTKFGHSLARELDKEVDAIAASFEKTRTDDISEIEEAIKVGKDAQWRAEGQTLLMDAKKENVAMQLEAAYRERLMLVYKMVKGRMDYQVKLYRAQARIQQKWMLQWILNNVRKSITPEVEKQALKRAIEDLSAAAIRAK